jgi:hypothetical protein
VGHTHNTKTYIQRRRSDELHFEKKTPINTNIQRRRRSDEHQFATKKNKKTHP